MCPDFGNKSKSTLVSNSKLFSCFQFKLWSASKFVSFPFFFFTDQILFFSFFFNSFTSSRNKISHKLSSRQWTRVPKNFEIWKPWFKNFQEIQLHDSRTLRFSRKYPRKFKKFKIFVQKFKYFQELGSNQSWISRYETTHRLLDIDKKSHGLLYYAMNRICFDTRPQDTRKHDTNQGKIWLKWWNQLIDSKIDVRTARNKIKPLVAQANITRMDLSKHTNQDANEGKNRRLGMIQDSTI